MFVQLPDRDRESAAELKRIIDKAKQEIAQAFAVPARAAKVPTKEQS